MGNAIITISEKALNAVIAVICTLLLLIGIYSLLDNLWLYEHAQDDSMLRYRPVGEETLTEERRITENQIAWLTMDDTTIDYPVMQGRDNYEYLNKDPYGNFSLSGSVFLDAENAPDFSDGYSLIYGHHMEKGVMFGALDRYRDEKYFNTHRTGTITTETAVYRFTAFAVCSAEATDEVLFLPKGRTSREITAYLKENALIYKDPEKETRLVALSTCSGDTDFVRLLVIGTIEGE